MVLRIVLSIIFLVLNWLDFYLTKCIIASGGRELNPIVNTLGLLPVKIGSSVFVIACALFLSKWVLIPIDIVLLGICIWNFIQFRIANG